MTDREWPLLLEKAIRIAVEKHAGQVEKAGRPYILHPLRVMMQMRTDPERIVAVLHDVIEDCGVTPEWLLAEGFPREIVDAILSVSRLDKSESYDDFIRRSAANSTGRIVKIADLRDNLDVTRLAELTQKDLERLNRYRKALNILD
jgi:(p)ppGpp synthase/HD superfamily hydrolase